MSKYKKHFKTLKTAFKWLLIIILLFLLINFIKDFIDHYNMLIGKVSEQGDHINNLNGTIDSLKEANEHLVNQVNFEHSKVEELQNQLTVKINNQPVEVHKPVVTVDDIKKEVEPSLKFPDTSYVPITIVGVMTVLKGIITKGLFAF